MTISRNLISLGLFDISPFSSVIDSMEKVTNVRVEPCESSRFIRPLRLRYTQDEREKVWDVVVCHASVYVLIYNTTRKKLVFVKQFRPAVYFSAARNEQVL